MILWHNKDPIYSIDFDSSSERFCTTGFDNDIKIWSYSKDKEGHLSIEYLASLSKHTKPVNTARFSPAGNLLASGSDDGTVIIWKLNPSIPPTDSMKETWSIVNILRVTTDAYDLCWSSDGLYIGSASTDNSVSIWSPLTKICNQIITEHTHYVQGVSWDPLNNYLLTQSSDGTCRLYKDSSKKKSKKGNNSAAAPTADNTSTTDNNNEIIPDKDAVKKNSRKKIQLTISNVISKRSFNNSNSNDSNNEDKDKDKDKDDINSDNNNNNNNTADKDDEDEKNSLVSHRMYYDERASTFFRRPCWSPDGLIFITPTGKFKNNPTSKFSSTTYLFSRYIRDRPIVHLPSNCPTVVAKFSPVLYKNKESSTATNNGMFDLPYRMIFAVATQDTIVVYDTSSIDKPIALVSNLHYSTITDIGWSTDGTVLFITSEDGFCSYVSFLESELGPVLPESDYPDSIKQIIALKQQALLNSTISNSDTASLKRKHSEIDNINNNGSNASTTIDSNNVEEKKIKLDNEQDTTTPMDTSSNNTNTNTTNTTTTTTTTTTTDGAKPKRRIQPNLLSK
ncbi:hypothetical protein CYY_005360 [Polysphondylium violaceum]|uniref:CAF1B/HIR1 beta-propeller domain-containing protein n=1 Tax=Polysphondylium violaceum TaxID=133409 RepID=A0A8J4PTN8_9MYCE|nr:hypothetical protein CYY_005360 [Polysphondylium violaceum]